MEKFEFNIDAKEIYLYFAIENINFCIFSVSIIIFF